MALGLNIWAPNLFLAPGAI